MSGNLSAELLAETGRPDRQLHLALEVAFATGTEWWGPLDPWDSASQGYLLPYVQKFGTYSISADPFGSIARPTKAITILDVARHWSRRRICGEPLAGTVFTTWLCSPRVARANWKELHQGLLLPKWTGTPGGAYQLNLDASAGWLNNRIGEPVTEALFPNCPAEEVGKLIPIALGTWDASGGTQKGAVTMRRVSTTEYVGFGWWKSFRRVFRAGALKATPADYAVSYPIIGGKRFSKLTFTVSPGNDEVTADVEGIESVGDGSGTLISTPTGIVVWLLANRCYRQNPGIAWSNGSDAPINLASAATVATFQATRARGAPFIGSDLITGDALDSAPTGWSKIEEHSACWGIGTHFGFDGDIAFLIENPHQAAYVTSPELRAQDIEAGSNLDAWAPWTSCRRLTARYGTPQTGQEASFVVRDDAGEEDGERVVAMARAAAAAR